MSDLSRRAIKKFLPVVVMMASATTFIALFAVYHSVVLWVFAMISAAGLIAYGFVVDARAARRGLLLFVGVGWRRFVGRGPVDR